MPLNLVDYESRGREAVRRFWSSRQAALGRQAEARFADRGERGGVTAGKNMDGFVDLIRDIAHANDVAEAEIQRGRAALTLPGYFRPTKQWDLLLIRKGQLIAAIELKSQVGPSFGNNFNNRCEEAIGSAHDLRTAYREGAFGTQPPPFVGWLMLVEDAPASRQPVRERSPHFPLFAEFKETSYLHRYDLLCQKLVREQLYTATALLASPRSALETGEFSTLSPLTSFESFVTSLAGHIAVAAARQG